MWETQADVLRFIQAQVNASYAYITTILGVEDPDEEFNAGTYVQGTAVAGYYAENGSSYVDTSFSYIMGTNMPAGSTIYNAPWGSCVTAAAPSNVNTLVITPSTGAVTFNVPATRTNFDDVVTISAVQIGWNNNQKPLYNAQNHTTPYQGTSGWVGIQQNIDSTNLPGASGQPYYNPLPADTTTFNNYRQAVVIYVNNNNDGLDDITIDDVPEWPTEPTEPTETTEPTEPPSGFVFDYDEVINPSELREELNAETYNVTELNTELSSETYPIVLPPHDGNDPQAITQVALFIPTALQAGKEFLQYHGVYGVFISAAVISAIATIIKGGK